MCAWQDVVTDKKETSDDLINTKFKVFVKMRQTAYERQLLEQNISVAMQTVDGNGNPLISFKDAFTIRNIKNFKLAELYLANKIEENKKRAREDSEKLQEQNAQVQQASAKMAADEAKKLQDEKLDAEKDMKEFEATKQKEIELLKGFMAICAKDETGTMVKILMPAIQQLVPNIAVPLQQENKQMVQGIQMQAMQEQMAAQQQEQPQQQPQEQQQNIQQPQMQMA